MEKLLTAKEAAELVGADCGVSTIRKAFRNKELAGMKIGRSYAFTERDIQAWLEAKRQTPTSSPLAIDAAPTARSAARHSRRSS